MPALPGSITLTQPANGSTILASDARNDNSAVQTAVNGLITALDDGVAGQMLGGAGSTVTFAYPPGYKLAHNAITAAVNFTSTAAATPNDVIAGTAVSYDGTEIEIEFFFALLSGPAGTDTAYLDLWDGTTRLGQIAAATGPTDRIDGTWKIILTPAAGSHTYRVRGYVTAGTGTLQAGAGDTGGVSLPSYIRVKKT